MSFPASIANEYAHATECQIATLCEVMDRKSSSKTSIERHKKIAVRMLGVCRLYENQIDWTPVAGSVSLHFSRLKQILDAHHLSLEGALMRRLEGTL